MGFAYNKSPKESFQLYPLTHTLSLLFITHLKPACLYLFYYFFFFNFNWVLCFLLSILQGAWLRLLWRAGRDCDGSAVGQGPGRPLLCQPGPQQRLDGHGSPDLTSAPESHYSPPACLPTYLSVWLMHSQSNLQHQHLTRCPTNSPAGQSSTNDHLRIMSDVQINYIKVWACSNNTTQSLVGHYIAHIAFKTQTAYFSEFSENEQDSRD